MTLLILGNSVSNPPFDGAPSYPGLLAARLKGIAAVQTIIGSGETIEQMEERALAALSSGVDRLVLQVGINECAPRPLAVAERSRLGSLRPLWLQRRIIRLIHRFRARIIRSRELKQFMTLPAFTASVQRVLNAAQSAGVRVLILPITTVTPVAERRTPFTNREIARYNAALSRLASSSAQFASQSEIFGTNEATMLVASPDTVHLSPASHDILANYILQWLDAAAVRSEAV